MIGSQIGQYHVLGKIGAGGMGEVYRARDTKLGRDVALKILPDAFAADPERRARFGREARTLASLNHPHIAQIYGFEESSATSALAMELVEGEDLAVRIRRGPIPYDEAMAIARQIAEALAAAHDQGIIHRDLKPANIKLREDGTIKVLDFGLAKALEPAALRNQADASALANSPTITSPAGMTLGGVILGTAAYMSPEQAKGRPVDKRADIWAFGCVLYEMLTGRRAFGGDDVSDTLASVLKSDVDWTGVPRPVVRLLKKCLEKDPRRRLHDIGDVWDFIDESTPPAASAPSRVHWIGWALSGLLLISTIVLAALYFVAAPARATVRFQIVPPPNQEFAPYFAVSPDGRRLAFTATDEKRIVHLWVRDLDSLDARRLPGTEGVRGPFWSPDSRYLAFSVGTMLKKIDATTGPAQTIATVSPNSGAGQWRQDGVILFGSRGGDPIHRVAAAGGTPVPVTALDVTRNEVAHAFPSSLPDGRHFLYFRQSSRQEIGGIYVAALDRQPEQQDSRLLAATDYGPYFVAATADGFRLLFMRQSTLLTQSFDANTLELTGDPVAIADGLGSSGSLGFFSASETALVTRTGPASMPNSFQPTWVDRTGTEVAKVGEPGRFGTGRYGLSLSPNGRLAVAVMSSSFSSETDLWLLDLARGILSRFTTDPSSDQMPVWSPDGTRIAFRSGRSGSGDVFVKQVTNTAEPVALIETSDQEGPGDWSPDGRFVLYIKRPRNLEDLWVWPVAEPNRAKPLFETRFIEQGPRFSPDGRWIAYESDESGTREIYARPFVVSAQGEPSVGAAWRVSTNGGEQAHWRRDSKELFYRDVTGAIVAVDITVKENELQTGVPKRLFAATGVSSWDVTADGQRFLLLVPAAQAMPDPLTVVLNWQLRK